MEGRQYISRGSRYNPSPGGVTLRWVPGAVIPGGGIVDRGMVMMYSCGLLPMISWAVVLQKKVHRRNLASPSPTVTHSEPLPIDTISPCACIQAAPHLLPGRPACPSTVPRRWSINGSIWLSLFFLSFPSPAFPSEQIIEGNKRGPVLYIAETASLPPDLGEPGLVDGGSEVIYLPASLSRSPFFSRSPVRPSVLFVANPLSP